ncbi:unnamed protein product [Didymodactylos carnosus]|uniref:Uncharacterized protein n=1 Tax=Didymodactylos carnosus TaxID=1234261 RepID=A0A814KTD3_9BILA|nr:unnamed protein product [Didymodactylos carnosus]CAF1639305.1 unnamed protein product [Didymodactylos carnosus]CAF3823182.1 unnamed protein product [Didymodactylos carnosus]CAF4473618.1 unnamed protein product [Didymodactylos carnosus]
MSTVIRNPLYKRLITQTSTSYQSTSSTDISVSVDSETLAKPSSFYSFISRIIPKRDKSIIRRTYEQESYNDETYISYAYNNKKAKRLLLMFHIYRLVIIIILVSLTYHYQ